MKKDLDTILRQIWIDGWERGKKQHKTPYNYTLSDEKFLKKKWQEVNKIIMKTKNKLEITLKQDDKWT